MPFRSTNFITLHGLLLKYFIQYQFFLLTLSFQWYMTEIITLKHFTVSLKVSYANPQNDRLVEVPRSMPLLFRRDKTKKVNNQMFVMIWQKNIFQSWSQFCCGKVSFWSSEFDDWIWDLKLSKFIHSFEIILLNHKIRFQLFLDLRWIRFEWIQHYIQL